MKRDSQVFDLCIVCALPKEARAFLEIVKQQCKVVIHEQFDSRYNYDYRWATLENDKGELLTLHVSWLPRYGPQEMIMHLQHILEEFRPRIAIMTGICAGDVEQEVFLGDLIVAERTFPSDNGKFVLENGRSVQQFDTLTYQLDASILQFLGDFNKWKPPVARLRRPPKPPELHGNKVTCHIKAMASGNAVRADHPFKELQTSVRGAVAIDMEGAAFSLVMSRHHLPWLIVKSVSDYADGDKNDIYHNFAMRASALYALSFIRAYVTSERLPPREEPSDRAGPSVDWNIPHTHNASVPQRDEILDQPQQLKQERQRGTIAAHGTALALFQSIGISSNRHPGKTGSPIRLRKRSVSVLSFLMIIIFLLLSSAYIFNSDFLSKNIHQGLSDQNTIEDANLLVHLLTTQSPAWEILRQPITTHTPTLLLTPIGAVRTDEKPYNPFSIILEIQREPQQHFIIFVEHIHLIIQDVPPGPQQLSVGFDHGEHVNYVSNLFQAFYEGEQSGGEPVEAEYQDQPETVVLAPNEYSDKIKIQVFSLQQADIQFRIQLVYRLSPSSEELSLLLPHTFEVIFSDGSNWHVYENG